MTELTLRHLGLPAAIVMTQNPSYEQADSQTRVMLLRRHATRFALLGSVGLAAALGGCGSATSLFEGNNDGGWFSKKVDIFAKPDWATPSESKSASATLDPVKPITADDLVSADGLCAGMAPAAGDPSTTGAVEAQPAAVNPVQQPTFGQPVLGGIALGMSECETVRRAGRPMQVNISADEKGERLAVLTYMGGQWPGIYKFSGGRLREIERVAEPEQPKQPPKKKAKLAKPKTAQPSRARSVQ